MFQFRLEKVLRHRRHLVEDEARKLQVLAAALNRLLAERRQLEEDADLAAGTAWRGRQRDVDIAVQRSAAAFIASRRTMIQRLDQRVANAQRETEAQRARLVAAQQEVSVLESLEDKQRRQWELEQRRREQKQFDELGGRRGVRYGP